jgi:Bifunctional DNA primase/polymerase, N-terminal/Family of unknown function (DUF5906)
MSSTLDAALEYIAQGFAPVPIPHRAKGPIIDEWHTLRISVEDAPKYFNCKQQNIGVILGGASGGLTDLDLDSAEAIAAAPYLLPPTAIFGHESKPDSHWIYKTNLFETQDRAAIKFLSADKAGLLEVRMGGGDRGAQTVFPPSTHVSGEPIKWKNGEKILEVDGAELLACANRLAVAAQLARAFPQPGGRHDAAFVLGGFLARHGLSVPLILRLVKAVAVASKQPEDKCLDMIRTATAGAGATKQAGFPLLAETFGRDVAEKVSKWLGYQQTLGGEGEAAPPENNEILDDFYALLSTNNFVFVPNGDLWPADSVNRHLPAVRVGSAKPITPARWLARNRFVHQLCWAPGQPQIIEDVQIKDGGWIPHKGGRCFNIFHPFPHLSGDPAKAEKWIGLVHYVYPSDADHIIKYLAHCLQKPGVKINHALLNIGEPGIGKDSILEPIKRAIGHCNFAEAAPKDILNQFNKFLRNVILRVSEGHDTGDVDRFKLYEALKTIEAAPPDVLRINEKNKGEYYIANVGGVIITSNYKMDGIYLPENDRRHYVACSERVKEDFSKEHWGDYWNWLDNGGAGHVAAYLKALDISGFDSKAPPPKTAAFYAIADAARATEIPEALDVIDALGNPDAVTLSQLRTKATGEFKLWLDDRKNRRTVPHRLEQCGYVPVRNPDAKDGLWKIADARQVVYADRKLSLQDQMRAARELAR